MVCVNVAIVQREYSAEAGNDLLTDWSVYGYELFVNPAQELRVLIAYQPVVGGGFV